MLVMQWPVHHSVSLSQVYQFYLHWVIHSLIINHFVWSGSQWIRESWYYPLDWMLVIRTKEVGGSQRSHNSIHSVIKLLSNHCLGLNLGLWNRSVYVSVYLNLDLVFYKMDSYRLNKSNVFHKDAMNKLILFCVVPPTKDMVL